MRRKEKTIALNSSTQLYVTKKFSPPTRGFFQCEEEYGHIVPRNVIRKNNEIKESYIKCAQAAKLEMIKGTEI